LGPTSKGKEGEGRKGKEGGKGKRGEGKERKGTGREDPS